MKTFITYTLAAGLLAVTTQTSLAFAESEAKKPASAAVKKDKAPAQSAFRGKVAAVDKTAMTFSVEEKAKTRTFHITSHTRITKAGKPATTGDVVVGEEVVGKAIKNPAGEEEAVAVRVGGKAETKPAKKKAPKKDEPKKD